MKVGYIYVDRDRDTELLLSARARTNCVCQSQAELDITCVYAYKNCMHNVRYNMQAFLYTMVLQLVTRNNCCFEGLQCS